MTEFVERCGGEKEVVRGTVSLASFMDRDYEEDAFSCTGGNYIYAYSELDNSVFQKAVTNEEVFNSVIGKKYTLYTYRERRGLLRIWGRIYPSLLRDVKEFTFETQLGFVQDVINFVKEYGHPRRNFNVPMHRSISAQYGEFLENAYKTMYRLSKKVSLARYAIDSIQAFIDDYSIYSYERILFSSFKKITDEKKIERPKEYLLHTLKQEPLKTHLPFKVSLPYWYREEDDSKYDWSLSDTSNSGKKRLELVLLIKKTGPRSWYE